MAKTTITIIDASKLPVSRRGFSAGGPSIGIRENGQITFSTALTKALGIVKETKVAVGFDSNRLLHFYVGDEPPKGVPAEKLMTIRFSTKNKNASMNGAGFLHKIVDAEGKEIGGLGYDFKTSSNQVFNGDKIKALDSAAHHVAVELPEGALTPKLKAPRKPRTPKAAKPAAGVTDAQAVAAAAGEAPASGDAGSGLEFN